MDAGVARGGESGCGRRTAESLATARLSAALGDACRSCPEQGGALRRELLCRCPVALALRLLDRVGRGGADPVGLSPSDQASFNYQERSLVRRLPDFEPGSLERASSLALELRVLHAQCGVPACLACRAADVVVALERRVLGAAVPA